MIHRVCIDKPNQCFSLPFLEQNLSNAFDCRNCLLIKIFRHILLLVRDSFDIDFAMVEYKELSSRTYLIFPQFLPG